MVLTDLKIYWTVRPEADIIENRMKWGILIKLKNRAKKLKAEAQVLILAYKDKRTPISAKILIWVTVGYFLSPIDLIPDFIPVLGLLDDLVIVPALIALSIKLIPGAVLQDARENLTSNPQRFKRNNWVFAIIIIVIWIAVLFLLSLRLKHIW